MNCTTYYRDGTFLLKVLYSSSRFYDVGYDWLVIGRIGMRCGLLMAICLCLVSFSGYAAKGKSDAQIKKEIIKESIESYPGNCACPYNHARNGSRCGGRSAYSRTGGYDVVCYESDVTDEMIRQWKQENAE
nr:MAG TPA: hypothetical protein [Caudoviricetes sp.]